MQKIGEKIFSIIKGIEENENKSKTAVDTLQSNDLYNSLVGNLDSKEMRK